MTALSAMVPQWTAVLGWTLIHLVWQATGLAAVLGFALLLIPRGFARTRYLAGCLTLMLMPALALATAWRLADPAEPASPFHEPVAATPSSDALTGVSAATPPETASPVEAQRAIAMPAGPIASIAQSRIDSSALMPWVVSCWLLGVLVCSLRLAGGWWQAQRLVTVGTAPAPDEWQRVKDALAARLGLWRPVRLLTSTCVRVPMVIGWLKPVLLVPTAVLGGLAPQQLEAVLAHELAHIRRYDYLVNFLQTAVETLLFYHPAVWWVSKIVRTEREHCCDDLAVIACGDRVLYARALTALETLRQEPVGIALAVTGSPLMARVRRLLGVRSPRPVSSSGWVVALMTVLMVSGAGITRWVGGLPNDFGAEHVVASPGQLPPIESESAWASNAVVPAGDEPAAIRLQSEEDARALAAAVDELGRARAEPGGSKDLHAASEALSQARAERQRALVQQQRAIADAARDARRAASESGRGARTWSREARQAADEAMRQVRELMAGARETLLEARASLRAAETEARKARRSLWQSHHFFFDSPPDPPEPPNPPEPPEPPAPADPVGPPDPPDAIAPPPPMAPMAPPAFQASPAAPAPPAPPAAPAPPAPPAPPSGMLWSQSSDDSSWNMTSSHDGDTLKVQAKGRLEFTDDDADVRVLSPGGYLVIEHTANGTSGNKTERFEARERNGAVTRTYAVNGKALSETEGRAWLKSFLPDMVRELAINADRRVARILATGGPAGVLADVSLTKSSHAKGAYLRELFTQTTLDVPMLTRSLEQAGKEVRSSYDLAQVLKTAAERQPIDATMTAFVEAAGSIESDYEQRHVFARVLARPSLTPAIAAQVFKSVTPGAGRSGISSDYELAELFAATPPSLIEQPGSGWFEAVSTIGSSYERRRAIAAVIRPGASPAIVDQALKAAAGISSDYELATLLVEVAKTGGLSDRTAPSYFAALAQVGSDYDHRRVLQAVAAAAVSDSALAQAVSTTTNMQSDYDRAESLVVISRSAALGPTTRKALADAANGIRGDHERGRVLSALTRAGVLTAR